MAGAEAGERVLLQGRAQSFLECGEELDLRRLRYLLNIQIYVSTKIHSLLT